MCVHRALTADGVEMLVLTPACDTAHEATRRRLQDLIGLQHKAIVPVAQSHAEGNLPCAVLPAPVGTLAERLAWGPLPALDAVAIAARLCGALHYAHRRGVVHGLLSPEWVEYGGDPERTRLLFGPCPQATCQGDNPYHAPERRLGGLGDERADIYGVGALLYGMLTGHAPVPPEEGAPLPSPRTYLPNLHPNLDALLMRCLDPDPDRRLVTCQDLALALYYHLSSPQAPFAPPEVEQDEVASTPAIHSGRVVPARPPFRAAWTPAGLRRALGWMAWVVVLALFGALLWPISSPRNVESDSFSGLQVLPADWRPPAPPALPTEPPLPAKPAVAKAALASPLPLPAPLPRALLYTRPSRPAAPPPPAVRIAQVNLARPRPAPPVQVPHGELLVSVEPSDRAVYVYVDGGDTRGRSPLAVSLPPGQHAVSLWDPEHKQQRDLTVEVAPGQQVVLHQVMAEGNPEPEAGSGKLRPPAPVGEDASPTATEPEADPVAQPPIP